MTQRQVYFHIGLHKTATTLLQETLFPRLQDLEYIRTLNRSLIRRKALEATNKPLLVSHEEFSGSLSLARKPGERTEELSRSLNFIASLSPSAGIIIAFRWQLDWINSAFAEKAKKTTCIPEDYLKTFDLDELLWCKVLANIDSFHLPVFGFLYEELLCCPDAFTGDLCSFLKVKSALSWYSGKRIKISPRSTLGRHVSRPFFQLSDALKRISVPKRFRAHLHQMGSALGTRVDRYAPPAPCTVSDELAEIFRADWNSLVERLGKRRGRDLHYSLGRGCAAEHVTNSAAHR